MIGETGNYLKKLHSQPIASCIGLDPAGAAFDGLAENYRISRDDCELVQVIHSSALTALFPFSLPLGEIGTRFKSGHCDFWINCGHFQLGCNYELRKDRIEAAIKGLIQKRSDAELIKLITAQLLCSHVRAAYVFASFISQKCDYKSELCDHNTGQCGQTNSLKKAAKCEGNPAGLGMSLAPYNDCHARDNLDFIIRTKKEFPYCSADVEQKRRNRKG